MGAISVVKGRRTERTAESDLYSDSDIIELWEM
jgi:hypothetical protein